MPSPVLQPGEIEAGAPLAPWLKLAGASPFADRAERLLALAEGHALADFLRFMAVLCRAQHDAYSLLPDPPLPSPEVLELCRAHAMPPLNAANLARAPQWRLALRQILDRVGPDAPPAARAAIERLSALDDAALEIQASTLLRHDGEDLDRAAAPFVAAALQVYWHRLAALLDIEDIGRPETPALCPVCGSPPVAGSVHVGAEHGLRYLHCALCGSEWNVVRIKCSNCENTKGIAYYGIEHGSAAVKAETCDACRSYLKILYLEKDPAADPLADDLASIALDLLLDEQGYQRSGLNYFLIPGPS